MIKSYRGQLPDGSQDRIRLSTPNGKTGHRIVKFQILPATPGDAAAEHCVKIYKNEQSSVDDNVNFGDNTLLGAAVYAAASSTSYPQVQTSVIFDAEIFNQDIYVTQKDTQGGSCNYYIELEQIPLTETEALVSIIKNLRIEQ